MCLNDKEEILDFILTLGNEDDREPLKNIDLHKRIFGKLFGDKGCISKDLFEQFFVDGVHLVTKLRKNMKNTLMLLHDRIMLRKRALIESVNDELKNMCQIECIRHRYFCNFIINTLSAFAAYSFFGKKPSFNTIEDIVEKDGRYYSPKNGLGVPEKPYSVSSSVQQRHAVRWWNRRC